jgi:hypothetical protein
MLFYMLPFHSFKQWGIYGLDHSLGKNNTIRYPVSFSNNLLFYWGFDYAGYYYDVRIKQNNYSSCFAYATYKLGTSQEEQLAPTDVGSLMIFIGR